MASWEQERVNEFLAASEAFRDMTIPYLAVAAMPAGDNFNVISARLVFGSPTAIVLERTYDSPALRAIIKRLPDLAAAEGIIWAILEGSFDIDGQRYVFLRKESAGGDIEVNPFNQTVRFQFRSCTLAVRGRETGKLFHSEYLDWALRASDPPYLGLNELLAEFGLPIPVGNIVFDAYHVAPIGIDRERSHLSGSELNVSVRLEPGIARDKVQVGLVAIKPGETAIRRAFTGAELSWEEIDGIQFGSLNWTVLPGRAVQAIAVLDRLAFHYWWIVDPQHILNARKAIFGAVDPDLTILRDFLVASGSKGREFESAVSWLLWMLGFSVAHLGAETKTQDAVDILAASPAGNFALVECTTGVIAADKKVANLVSRCALVAEKLKHASHNNVRVLPILVTSKSRDEVIHEIEPARERGVLVLTRDDLVELLNRTDVLPNADQLYQDAESQVTASAAAEPQLPGIQ